MKILRANHLGMCFGVRDAIALAVRHSASQPITVLGELVHNETVLASLRAHGVRIADQPERVTTSTVMITAHGASERRMDEVRKRGLTVIEATCPLVHYAHRAVSAFVATGYHPVIVGQRDHVEVRGMTEDLEHYDVILQESDIEEIEPHPKFGVAAQTTQPSARVRHLVSLLQRRFPDSEVRFSDTVCQPTKQRQFAAVELASECDVVVVVGGLKSNNTRELVATCRLHCPLVHHVQSATDLERNWFGSGEVVGITAGTSTPDDLIDEVERCLREWASDDEAAPAAWEMPEIKTAVESRDASLVAK